MAEVPANADPPQIDGSLGRLRLERASTVEQVESLTHDFDDIVASAESVATDDEHDPEGHTIAFERQQVAGLLRAARSHLGDLDDAISRHEAGKYGECERCGGRIADERLIALASARTCIVCAQ